MIDIKSISTGLKLADDGIWYSSDKQKISYPADGNDNSFNLESDSFWFTHRNACIVSVVKSYPPDERGTIFDIGGGNGFVSLGLTNSGFNVVLVEPGRVGAYNAKARGVDSVICATTNTAQFKQNSLPAVGLYDVIEHIEDDVAFLQSIRKIMKKNGRLYVTVPSYSFLWSAEDVAAGHFKRYTLKHLSKTLKAAGFEVDFASYIFRTLPLPIFFMRALPYKIGFKKARKIKGKLRDHNVKRGFVTIIFNAFLQLELENLALNKPMRFGGSCLIAARKA